MSTCSNNHIRPSKRRTNTSIDSIPAEAKAGIDNPPPRLPKSVLRTPKYSKAQITKADPVTQSDNIVVENAVEEEAEHSIHAAVQETVIERPRKPKNQGPPLKPPATTNHEAVEVHTPSLVFGSLADLMEHAGTLPQQPQGPIDPGSVVEAEIAFSCMDPDAYKQQLQDEEEEGRSEDSETSENDEFVLEVLEDDDGDEIDYYDDEDTTPPKYAQPRAFLVLWKALSQWVTPQVVQYVKVLQNEPVVEAQAHNDTSDVGLSRCAGLMALLQMHIAACWDQVVDVHVSQDALMCVAERRVADMLRCFDYSRPMPTLDARHARALTCILLRMVLNPHQCAPEVPAACQVLQMKLEEYQYLSCSAILNFQGVQDDEEQSGDQ